MKFALVDDDEAIRYMLEDIIEDYDLGEVVLSLPGSAGLTPELLMEKEVGIVILDLLMPGESGTEAAKRITPGFPGKIIMLSEATSKDMVGSAYAGGVDYYITKPLNRNEIVSVVRNVSDHLRLAAFAESLKSSLAGLGGTPAPVVEPRSRASAILKDLGIAASAGAQDLLAIAETFRGGERKPSLKSMLSETAARTGGGAREAKAMEQRLRRTIYQALLSVASMGVADYTNPRFEDAATTYFDYADVLTVMRTLEQGERPALKDVHINMKKFLHAFLEEGK